MSEADRRSEDARLTGGRARLTGEAGLSAGQAGNLPAICHGTGRSPWPRDDAVYWLFLFPLRGLWHTDPPSCVPACGPQAGVVVMRFLLCHARKPALRRNDVRSENHSHHLIMGIIVQTTSCHEIPNPATARQACLPVRLACQHSFSGAKPVRLARLTGEAGNLPAICHIAGRSPRQIAAA